MSAADKDMPALRWPTLAAPLAALIPSFFIDRHRLTNEKKVRAGG
jgi:hypothetical protein